MIDGSYAYVDEEQALYQKINGAWVIVEKDSYAKVSKFVYNLEVVKSLKDLQ